jgi:hypothetical protein
MNLKIDLPKKVAICLFATDENILNNQLLELSKLHLSFEVEYWFRYKKNPINYNSFSQMINEAIDDTDSEFMVFINPKSKIILDDINFIITKLCSGFCAVYTSSFGLHGSTKELFRQIGMYDERFIHSECEDDDFMLRLGILNKAIFYNVDKNKYDYSSSSYRDTFRGISHSIFSNKWYKDENDKYYLNPEYKEVKQISKRHQTSSKDISASWLNYNETFREEIVQIDEKSKKFFNVSKELNSFNKEKIILDNFKLNIEVLEDKNIKILLQSSQPVTISAHFVDPFPSRKWLVWGFNVLANNWRTINLNAFNYTEEHLEIRIYLDNIILYTNTINVDLPSQILEHSFLLPVKIRI